VVAAGCAWIRPGVDVASRRLERGGEVDRLRLTCVEGK
jgi:hypothetical protein